MLIESKGKSLPEFDEQYSVFNEVLLKYFDEYKKIAKPIEVNFRNLVPELKGTDRYTHIIHRYPAKLLAHIPHFFLNNTILSKPDDWVLDPFCGSGTVLLESILSERRAIGSDSNPLARLISKVKTTPLKLEKLNQYSESLSKRISTSIVGKIPNVVNVDYWFSKRVKKELAVINEAISEIDDANYKDFFLVCFSACVKNVSNCDPRVSVPVKLKYEKYPSGHPLRKESRNRIEGLETTSAIDKFFGQVRDNTKRIEILSSSIKDSSYCSLFNDARSYSPSELDKHNIEKVSLVITSPPYAGAQKYIRSSSLNLGWLGYTEKHSLRDFEKSNIGREHYYKHEYQSLSRTGIKSADTLLEDIYEENSLRAHIAANYLIEMKTSFQSVVSIMKKGGYFVLVAANNIVCKREFMTREYLLEILLNLGLKLELEMVDDIQSYGLMTKRNKTANVITREWVMVLKK